MPEVRATIAALHLPARIVKLAVRGQSFLQGLRPVEMKA
jgi:hypothetical protein